jgi:hypothetical protein
MISGRGLYTWFPLLCWLLIEESMLYRNTHRSLSDQRTLDRLHWDPKKRVGQRKLHEPTLDMFLSHSLPLPPFLLTLSRRYTVIMVSTLQQSSWLKFPHPILTHHVRWWSTLNSLRFLTISYSSFLSAFKRRKVMKEPSLRWVASAVL